MWASDWPVLATDRPWARKGEKGGVREDSVLGSRWLDRWQHHSLKLETCRSEREDAEFRFGHKDSRDRDIQQRGPAGDSRGPFTEETRSGLEVREAMCSPVLEPSLLLCTFSPFIPGRPAAPSSPGCPSGPWGTSMTISPQHS